MMKNSPMSYKDISYEYYDYERHPTCANFREASLYLIRKWLRYINTKNGLLCEIGAGKALLAEILSLRERDKNKLIIMGSVPSMLAYSLQFANRRTCLVTGDALNLPITSESLDVIVSSLGDPYNELKFWREAHRALRDRGTLIFTTPAYDWAVAFRSKTDVSDMMLAEFELLEGKQVFVPSWIYPRADQIAMIEKSGLFVQEYAKVPLLALNSEHLSPKLLSERGSDAGVVEGYLVTKAGERS